MNKKKLAFIWFTIPAEARLQKHLGKNLQEMCLNAIPQERKQSPRSIRMRCA